MRELNPSEEFTYDKDEYYGIVKLVEERMNIEEPLVLWCLHRRERSLPLDIMMMAFIVKQIHAEKNLKIPFRDMNPSKP